MHLEISSLARVIKGAPRPLTRHINTEFAQPAWCLPLCFHAYITLAAAASLK